MGNLDHALTEGDVLAVMSQFGEVEDMHLVREEDTGKSKGFGFVKYEDARSCILAVDNLIGIQVRVCVILLFVYCGGGECLWKEAYSITNSIVYTAC